jgi:hypothetical protein
MQAHREVQNEKSVYSEWLGINVVSGLEPVTLVLPQQ